jgi:dihydrofolate reductase
MLLLKKNNFSLSTDFKKTNNSHCRKLDLKLKLDLKSNLIYLENYWNYKKIKPKFNWIKYSEPEDHLSIIEKKIKKYLLKENISKKNIRILSCSYKDISLSKYFRGYGLNKVIGKNLKYSGVEICQKIISYENIGKNYNLVLARHIIEHVFNLKKFFKSLKKVTTSQSIFFFEVPDIEKLIVNKDYNLIWEDHLSYFTNLSFKNLLIKENFQILTSIKIKQPFEDLICIIAKKKQKQSNISNKLITSKFKKQCLNFKKNFYLRKKKIKNFFLSNNNKKIFIFGAGHLTNTFIHLYKIDNYISFIIDENYNKIGMYFPNTNIKIISIKDFQKIKGNKICIIGANPLNESKIIKKLDDKKCKFYSMFLNSKRYILANDK